MTTKKIHNALIFLSFFLPFLLYFQTMAPTVSLWDCGEFIATSIIMGIPHPPGTPLYLIIGNFFSQIPILSDLGARVNLISVIASALSIMLLYMIIVYLIEKINKKESKVAYYAAFIGAITFAVTDSQWFNAVEAEVYALSTLFTAIVVWLILKWDRETNKLGVKYLILIFYCMGLAIGIHLLNLLAIPFIALIIFFHYIQKTNKEVTIYNLLLLSIMTGLSFLIIYKGIIKGLPSIIDKTQNPLILSLFFIVIILSTIIINIKLNTKFNLLKHIAISSFSLMIIFITMNELVVTDYIDDIKNEKMGLEYAFEKDAAEMYNKILAANNINARDTHIDRWEEMVQEYTTKINNLDLTIKEIDANGFTYGLLISKQSGQSIFYLVIALMIVMAILSHYYTQHNKYNGNQYYKISQLIINCLFMVLLGYSTYALIFIRAQHNPQINYNNPHDIKSAYQYINRDQYGQWDIFDRKTSMLINSQQNHESWKRYTSDPKKVTTEEVVRFVWDYQFNEMYFRYFAWQFIGKEKWDEKTWERNSIDGKRLFTMPPLQGVDWLRYGLPIAFLIGLYGLYYQFKRY